MAKKESTARILVVALLVCLICSVFVTAAAVILKPLQTTNRLLDKQLTILAIAGFDTENLSGAEAQELFEKRIQSRVVDLRTGQFDDQLDAMTFDPLTAAKDPAMSRALEGSEDIASIRRLEQYSTVYLVEQNGQLETLILPVRGYGLWSTLHGFVALKGDLNTIVGFGFYQHAETPGLGGEVDNPKWKQLWVGKTLFDQNGHLAVEIVKGSVDGQSAKAVHQVDGLAGATLTSQGVNNLLHFWLGENGFGPLLAHLKKEGA